MSIILVQASEVKIDLGGLPYALFFFTGNCLSACEISL